MDLLVSGKHNSRFFDTENFKYLIIYRFLMPVVVENKVETQVDFHLLVREVLRRMNTVSSGGREHFAERVRCYYSVKSYESFFRQMRQERPLLFGDFAQGVSRVVARYDGSSFPQQFRNAYGALRKISRERKYNNTFL